MTSMDRPWEHYRQPFAISDTVYFVGCHVASSHLIDTGDGLILLDSGYLQNLYQVIHNIHQLGFDHRDIKWILHTHGHIDHMGGTRALAELTGAKTLIGAEDRDYANGTLDLSWAREIGFAEYFEAFEPDILLHGGDEITLGNTTIRVVSTPGHTPGTKSYFFNTTLDGKSYLAGMHGGVGTNSMTRKFLEQYGLSFDCRQQFFDGLEELKKIPVQVFLGNHVWNNHGDEKVARMRAGEKWPFLDPAGWLKFLDQCKADLEYVIKEGI